MSKFDEIQFRYSLVKYGGMTPDEYSAALTSQNGLCAICKEPPTDDKRLAIDHDHTCCSERRTCGKCVRGLLCINCNHLLGKAQESIRILQAAISYLQSFSK